jgi:O-antigen ligase
VAGSDEVRTPGRRAGQIAFAATALFLAQLYIAPSDWFPELQPLRLALCLSALSLGCLVAFRLLGNQPLWLGWRTAALFTYAGTAALSPIWSFDASRSVYGAIEVAKHFLFFLAVTNTATTPGRIRTALVLFAVAAIFPGLGTYLHYANGELLVEGFRGRWYGVMADPNHDAMALVAAVPLLLSLVVWGRSLWQRIAGLVGAVGCLMGIVATHSRGGSIGLAVGLLAWALLAKHKALALAATGIAAAGLLILAPQTFWTRNQTLATYEEDESVHGRVQALHVAGRSIEEHPFIGVGEQAFLAAWDHYAPLDAGHSRYVAHNLFLEVLAELGLTGFIGLMVFILASLWSAWKARKGVMGVEARAVLASLLGYLVCQLFSGYSLSWFLYALCGFAACIDHWAPKKDEEPAPRLSSPPKLVILGVVRPDA